MLKDKRNIDYLRISVTDRCNLRCAYCMPARGIKTVESEELLSFEEILRLVRIFAQLGIKKVRITGGEPLVRKGVLGLIRSIRDIRGIEQVALTTNSILFARRNINWRKRKIRGLARRNTIKSMACRYWAL